MHKDSNIVKHNYNQEEYVNKLTVKLKNAVMVHWLKVNSLRNKAKFSDMVEALKAKKKMEREFP